MTEDPVARLMTAARELVDAVSFDENGALLGGKWMGGNGGLVSRATHEKADAVRRILDCLQRQRQSTEGTLP